MQNCGKDKGYGARTGEMSADMILDFGLNWTLTGNGGGDRGLSCSVRSIATRLIPVIKVTRNAVLVSGKEERTAVLLLKRPKLVICCCLPPPPQSIIVPTSTSDCPGCRTFCNCMHWGEFRGTTGWKCPQGMKSAPDKVIDTYLSFRGFLHGYVDKPL